MTEQWVTLSHGRTRYLSAGAGQPVLLLHGAGFISGAHSWLPVISGLAENFHVIAPDMLGWGPGDQLTTPYSFGYLVDFVREFQDALGLNPASVWAIRWAAGSLRCWRTRARSVFAIW